MKIRVVTLLAVSAALIGMVASSAEPADASHSWGPYHWARTGDPFTLTLVNSVTPDWDSYLGTAKADWAVSDRLNFTEVQGSEGSTSRKRCQPINGEVRVCNANYGQNGWLGRASIWISGSHITQGITQMNDSYLNAAYNTPAWRRLVMCQEIGHTFGLGHQDEDFYNPNLGTCMDYTTDPAGTAANPDQLSNEHPNTHDYGQLNTIYSHLDSSNTFKATPTAGAGVPDQASNNRSDWGRVIRSDDQGDPILYRLDLGGGRVLFTWVFPARGGRGQN